MPREETPIQGIVLKYMHSIFFVKFSKITVTVKITIFVSFLALPLLLIQLQQNIFSFRMLFWEFRVMFQQLAMHEKCPGFVRKIIDSFIRIISNLAPAVAPTNTGTGTT